jgi:hypothetical protein
MTAHQKAIAANALGRLTLSLTLNDTWLAVAAGVEIKDGGLLKGVAGRGETPDAAIFDLWDNLTSLAGLRVLVINAMKTTRREVKWNGFMWVDA